MPEPVEPQTSSTRIVCLECGRVWTDETERWRVYLSGEDPPEHLTYCPDCASREFD